MDQRITPFTKEDVSPNRLPFITYLVCLGSLDNSILMVEEVYLLVLLIEMVVSRLS